MKSVKLHYTAAVLLVGWYLMLQLHPLGAGAAEFLPPGAGPSGLSLSVSGSRLVDQSGQTLLLHGVDMATTAYSCLKGNDTFNQPHSFGTLSAFRSWNINLVWIGLNEDCWLGINGQPTGETAAQYRSDILAWALQLQAAGIYVMLDLQWVAPGSYVSNSQEGLPDNDHAAAFWRSVASTMANEKGVLFNLLDEPTCFHSGADCSWAKWLNGNSGNIICREGNCKGVSYKPIGMNQLISAIRAQERSGFHHVIMAPALGFTTNLGQWPSYIPTDSANELITGVTSWATGTASGDCGWTDTACMSSNIGAPIRAGHPVIIYGQGGKPWSSANTTFLNWIMSHTSGESAWSWEDEGDGYAITSDGNGTATTYGANYKIWLAGQR